MNKTNIKDIKKEILGILKVYTRNIDDINVLYNNAPDDLLKKISKILDMVTLEEHPDTNEKRIEFTDKKKNFIFGFNQAIEKLNKKKETIKQQCLKELRVY